LLRDDLWLQQQREKWWSEKPEVTDANEYPGRRGGGYISLKARGEGKMGPVGLLSSGTGVSPGHGPSDQGKGGGVGG